MTAHATKNESYPSWSQIMYNTDKRKKKTDQNDRTAPGACLFCHQKQAIHKNVIYSKTVNLGRTLPAKCICLKTLPFARQNPTTPKLFHVHPKINQRPAVQVLPWNILVSTVLKIHPLPTKNVLKADQLQSLTYVTNEVCLCIWCTIPDNPSSKACSAKPHCPLLVQSSESWLSHGCLCPHKGTWLWKQCQSQCMPF